MGMTAYSQDGSVATVFTGMKRVGNNLVLQQLAAGQIPLEVVVTPKEALKSLSLGCSPGLIVFILLFPYFYIRQSGEKKTPPTPAKPSA